MEINYGNSSQGPGGNAFDGGIITQSISGDYQVVAYHLHPTPGMKPAWGPIGEFVIHRTSDQAQNFQRISFNALAGYYDPNLADPAVGFSINQEARGTCPRLSFSYILQSNDAPPNSFRVDPWHITGDGDIHLFYRVDGLAKNRSYEIALDTQRDTALEFPQAQGFYDSPKLRLTGRSHDGIARHSASWRAFVEILDTTGVARLVLQRKKDSGEWITHLTFGDDGTLSPGKSQLTPCEKAMGAESLKLKGQNGFEGWLMALNATQPRGADTVGSKVFSANGAALGPNNGWIVTEGPTGNVIAVPYWGIADINP